MRIITFGTFDLLHDGHINILIRSKYYDNVENTLIVGISSDELNKRKQKNTYQSLETRIDNLKKLNIIDEIFIEESLEDKKLYVQKYNAEILIMGSDWNHMFDWVGIKCVYLPRTNGISSTKKKNDALIKLNKFKFGFYNNNNKNIKHVNIMKQMFDKYNIKFNEYNQIDNYNGIILYDIPENEIKSDVPIYLIDTEFDNLDMFLNNDIYNFFDYIFLASKEKKKIIDNRISNNMTYATAYIESTNILSESSINKKDFMLKHKINNDEPIILYSSKLKIDDINELIANKNFINYSSHVYNTYEIIELIKFADIIVSDNPRILYISAALNKKNVQLIQKDDISIKFVGGILCNETSLLKTLKSIYSIDEKVFNKIYRNINKMSNINEDSDDIIIYNLLSTSLIGKNINKRYYINNINEITNHEFTDLEEYKILEKNKVKTCVFTAYKNVIYDNLSDKIFDTLDYIMDYGSVKIIDICINNSNKNNININCLLSYGINIRYINFDIM